jgi:hypothetical protein
MSAILESVLDDERRSSCAANDLAIEVSIYDAYDSYSSYARNCLMATHFPEQLEAERAARRRIPELRLAEQPK